MNICTFIFLISLAFVTNASAQNNTPHNVHPPAGYVPNAETAIRIAVAVWEPIYGKKQIAKQKPYVVALKDGVWFVEGSLPKGWLGGVAVAEISKDSGEIIRVSHGQ
jgi:hypothetical protein